MSRSSTQFKFFEQVPAFRLQLLQSLLWILVFLTPVFGRFNGFPQDSTQMVPKVYLDCSFCDFDFIRSKIPYVNYVYDRTNADIYILITRQHTGSGGREYTLTFLGQGAFAAHSDTLTVTTLYNDTDDEIRRNLARHIEIGLIPYIYNTAIMENLSISYEGKKDSVVNEDKWKLWFFRINLGGHFWGRQHPLIIPSPVVFLRIAFPKAGRLDSPAGCPMRKIATKLRRIPCPAPKAISG